MRDTRAILKALPLGVCLLAASSSLTARQQAAPPKPLQNPPNVERTFSPVAAYVPDLTGLVAATSELRDTVDRFNADRQALQRFHNIPGSKERREKLRAFYDGWLKALPKVEFAGLSREGQVDYVLLRTYIDYQLLLLGREERSEKEIAPLLPFADAIVKLQEDRQKLDFIQPDEAVAALKTIGERIAQQRAAVEASLSGGAQGVSKIAPFTAVRASQQLERLRSALDQWFGFYNGYDPAFTAKVPEPYGAVTQTLNDYWGLLRVKVAGLPPTPAGAGGRGAGGGRGGRGGGGAPPDSDDIVGNPIGRDG